MVVLVKESVYRCTDCSNEFVKESSICENCTNCGSSRVQETRFTIDSEHQYGPALKILNGQKGEVTVWFVDEEFTEIQNNAQVPEWAEQDAEKVGFSLVNCCS